MTVFRCGLVGYGRVAEKYYLNALSRCPSTILVAVADPAVERRTKASHDQPSCSIYGSAKELMDDSSVDAVIVTSPPDTHVPVVSMAIETGRSVLVEKPLAPSSNDALELVECVKSTGAYVQIGFNRRFWLPVKRLRGIMNSNQTGSDSAQLYICNDVSKWDPISGIPDALMDVGCHQLDLLRFLFSTEIKSIRAFRVDRYVAQMNVYLADGRIAQCRIAESQPSEEQIAVQCGGRRYRIHGGSDLLYPEHGLGRWLLDTTTAVSRRLGGRLPSLLESFDRQVEWFADSLRSGRNPEPNIHDGMRAVLAVDAARASIQRDGEEVHLPAW